MKIVRLLAVLLPLLAGGIYFYDDALKLLETNGVGVEKPTPDPGIFTEETMSKFFAPQPKSFEYTEPESIGTEHKVMIPLANKPSKSIERIYYSLGPTEGGPHSAVVLLHGIDRSGRSMLDMWQLLARKSGVVLLAPNAIDGQGWTIDDRSVFINDALVADAMLTYNIDPERLFLAGHSAGGKMALSLANSGEGPWRAVAKAEPFTIGVLSPGYLYEVKSSRISSSTRSIISLSST